MKLMYCLVAPLTPAPGTEIAAVGMIVSSGPTAYRGGPRISLEKFGSLIGEPLYMPRSCCMPAGTYNPLDSVVSELRNSVFIRQIPERGGAVAERVAECDQHLVLIDRGSRIVRNSVVPHDPEIGAANAE